MSWDLAPWGHIACWQKGFFLDHTKTALGNPTFSATSATPKIGGAAASQEGWMT